jgi:putative membrane protein
MKLILKWLLSACALLSLAHLYSGVVVTSFGAALLAALVIGLLNIFVRPALIVLTLPVTVLTMGLFLFVLNALMFWMAARLLEGFDVQSFSAAVLGSLLYSLMQMLIDYAMETVMSRKPSR